MTDESYAFFRCNGGEWFRGASCPLDGFSCGASIRVSEVAGSLAQDGKRVTLDALRQSGVSEEELRLVLIITFPAGVAAPTYFRPSTRSACERCGRPVPTAGWEVTAPLSAKR